MKRISIFLAGSLLLISSHLSAQSKKYVMLEHFTQASCGPCAQQNPIFEANIRANNEGTIHHIAYHTSWPGVDPMNAHNASQINTYTSNYGISGVPTMIMLGNQWSGGPANLTQAQVDAAAAPGSPIKVKVTDTDNGSTHDVEVVVHTTGVPPTGNFVLRAAVVEAMVTYATPPGNNGETEFPNVFRKFIANALQGSPYTPAATGSSVTYNLTYTEDAAWDQNEIYIIAWVENISTDEIINSGSSLDANWELNNFSDVFNGGNSGNTSSFNGGITNDGGSSELYRLTLTTDEPNDWSSEIAIGSNTYTTTVDTTVSGSSLLNFNLNVNPGSTPYVATYTIELESLDDPSMPHQTARYTVMSGITDLVVTNGAEADLSESTFLNGLASAGNTTYGIMPASTFKIAGSLNQLGSLINVYYNVGWTFPCFDDEMVTVMSAFNDNGGNIFMAGQDIAWSTFDAGSPYLSTVNSNYLNTYMGVGYSADGSTANSTMNPVVTDNVFATAPTMTIVDIHGGNMYPDELVLANQGVTIYNYSGGSKIGAIRQWTSHKSVYFGIDMGMVQNATNGEQIIAMSHDWFYGLLSTEEFDQAMLNLNAYPNPAVSDLTISFSELPENGDLKITDATGRIIYQTSIKAGESNIKLNVNQFENGSYFYTVSTGSSISEAKQIQVIK